MRFPMGVKLHLKVSNSLTTLKMENEAFQVFDPEQAMNVLDTFYEAAKTIIERERRKNYAPQEVSRPDHKG